MGVSNILPRVFLLPAIHGCIPLSQRVRRYRMYGCNEKSMDSQHLRSVALSSHLIASRFRLSISISACHIKRL